MARKNKAKAKPQANHDRALLEKRCRVAAKTLEITPEKGWGLSGWSSLGGSATRDPPAAKDDLYSGRRGLFCTVMVVDGGSPMNTLFLVSLDLHSCTRPVHSAVTKHIEDKYGVPSGNIIVNGSHTHAGPGNYYGNRLYDAMTVAHHNLLFGFR